MHSGICRCLPFDCVTHILLHRTSNRLWNPQLFCFPERRYTPSLC